MTPASQPQLPRLFLGFARATATRDDILELTRKMGLVCDPEHLSFNLPKSCAHLSIASTQDASVLEKAIKTFNNTKWKGGILRVELAKEHYTERLAREREAAKLQTNTSTGLSKKQTRRIKRLLRSRPVVCDKDVNTPVNDSNWKLRKDSGWKIIKRCGRAVLVVKTLMKVGAKKVTKIDPTKYPNKIVKLYPRASIPEPSVLELEWPGIPHSPRKPPASSSKPGVATAIAKATTAMQATNRLPLLSTNNPATDEHSAGTGTTDWTRESVMPSQQPHQRSRLVAKKYMPSFLLDSDDDDDDHNDKQNDTRGDAADTLNAEQLASTIGNQQDLSEERERGMQLLRGLLGMKSVDEGERVAHAPVVWRETVRYVPGMEGMEELMRGEDKDEQKEGEEEGAENVEEVLPRMDSSSATTTIGAGDGPLSLSSSSYVVTTNLRALVFGEDDGGGKSTEGGLFSWLGDQPPDQEPSGPGMLGDSIRERVGGVIKSSEKFSLLGALGIKDDNIEVDNSVESGGERVSVAVEVAAPATFGTTHFFFFHFDKPEFAARSLFENSQTFMRHDTMEDITREWEENRANVTQDFKKKHRSATRKRARMTRVVKGK